MENWLTCEELLYVSQFWTFQGRIYYESIGDYPAQSFFVVQNTSGAISVTQDLRQDNLRLNSYLVRFWL